MFNHQPKVRQIRAEEAKIFLNQAEVCFVDIRDQDSFASSHIPGAIPLGDDNQEEFLTGTDKSKKIIVCCYHGNSSQKVAVHLMQNGFTDVHSLSGGFARWEEVCSDLIES